MREIHTFNESNYKNICDYLGSKDKDLQSILDNHQYPPFWKRPPSFETLVHIILEQQVSLASAMAAMIKLKKKTGGGITAANLAALTNEELKDCYFSRQKISYTKLLANSLLNNELNLEDLTQMNNDDVRSTLTKLKGIGNWTVDIYLMMALQRSNLFPLGDVALMKSVKETKKLGNEISKESIAGIALAWKPYQTIAAFMLWHSYLCKRKR